MDGKGKKRQRSDDALAKAYQGVTFSPVASTGRPGTPHCFFKESYVVTFDDKDQEQASPPPQQVVHAHVNGLVIVTAGQSILPNTDTMMESIKVLVDVANVASQSAGNKRKQKAKMLKGKDVQDGVSPTDPLATIKLQNGKEIHLRCCAWGSVIEINPNLNTDLVREDPLLDGYLAVILPSGPFPPVAKEEETALDTIKGDANLGVCQDGTKDNV
uniref:Protein Abitram n=1 Tax=Amphora coffeiformis TaxID=265554 RepID=A0A7S3LBP3_9STRA